MQHQSNPLVILSPNHQTPPFLVQHNVPFGQPQPHPRQLAYGFGMSPQTPLLSPPAAVGWASSASPRGWGNSPGGALPAHQRVGSSSRRRRRSESSEGNEDELKEEAGDEMDTGTSSSKRGRNTVTLKKLRVGLGGNAGGNGEEETFLPPSGPTLKEGTADLGKALASLSKPALLTLLSTLLHREPSLKPLVHSLLPAPTLSNTLSSLSSLEKSVLNSLPTGDRSTMRDNYIWGRVRIPLEEYILESKSFLGAFCPTTIPTPSTISSSSVASGGGEESLHHPSTTFSFLTALTSSLSRLEIALPSSPSPSPASPLSSHLLPYLLNAWHLFLTRISTSINTEGRMISAQLLRSWFDKLDEMSQSAGAGTEMDGPTSKAMMGVKDRARRELGWVVGVRDAPGREESMGMMDDQDEEEL